MVRRPVVAMMALGLAGGLLASPAALADEEAPSAERLTVAFNAFENNLTPFTLSMQALPNTPDLVHLVYDALFWSQASAEPRPMLAESAEPSEDFSSWTIELREGVTWHDGEPFTADDVAFTYRYFTDVHPMGRFAHHVHDIPPFADAEVLDEHTVVLHFDAPAPTFLLLPGGDVPIVPEHIWEDIEDPGAETETLPVGTGPFELVDIEPDQLYRFEANEDYFLGRPTVDELVLPIVEDPSSVFAALQTGELDSAVHPVPPELVDDFEDHDDIELARSTRMESVILYFNVRDEPQSDPAVRKALALAIDRDEIVDTVMQGHAVPGRDTFTHPESIWATEDPVQDFDPDRANELLDEAGYELGDDGMRVTPDGDPVEIEVLVSSFAPQHIRAMQLAAEHAEEIGVELAVETLDPATIADRRSPEGPDDSPDVDAYVRAMEAHMHADPDAMIHFFGTPQPGRPGGGLTGYANPEFDELAEQAAVETDEDARLEMLHELQAMFAEEVPGIILYHPDGLYAYRPAAYDGWVEDPGHGIFNKLSFLPAGGQAGQGADDEIPDEAGDPIPEQDETPVAEETATGTPWLWLAGAALLVVLLVLLFLRGRSREEVYE